MGLKVSSEDQILAQIMEIAGPEAAAHAIAPISDLSPELREQHLQRVLDQLKDPLPRLFAPIWARP